MANARAKYTITAEDKTKNAIRGIRKNFGNLNSSAMALKGTILGLVGVGGFGALVKTLLDADDKIAKLSTRLGASTEALSQLKYAADLSGVSFNTLTMGLQRMTRRVAEASQGTGEAVKALQELNLSATDLAQLAPEDQFEVIADAINNVGSSSDKVRLAMKLFDSEGVSLLQTMEGGAAAIREMRGEADQLGLTLTKGAAKAAEEAKDELTRLQGRFNALGQTLVRGLGPALSDIVGWLNKELPSAAIEAQKYLVALEGGASDLAASFFEMIGAGSGENAKALRKNYETLADVFADLENRQKALFSSSAEFVGIGGGLGVGGADEKSPAQKEKEEQDLRMSQWTKFYKDWQKRHAYQIKWEQSTSKQRTKWVVGDMINMTAGISRESRKAFEINKAAGIANAVISAHEGATKSLAKYPWPLGGIMAGLSYAAGMAQVQAIKSSSFSSGGGGGAPSSAGTVPASDIPATPVTDPTTQDQGSSITVNIEGNVYDSDGFRRVLIEALEQADANDELFIRYAN